MGAGSSAGLPFSASTIDIYCNLPEKLTKQQCIEVVGIQSTEQLWSQFMTAESHTHDSSDQHDSCDDSESISRERLLTLSKIGTLNQKSKEKTFRHILPKIYFLDYEHFKSMNEFPRFNATNPDLLVLDDIDYSKAFIIFISHAWCRRELGGHGADSSDNEGCDVCEYPYPDTEENIHFKLCVEGIERIRENHIKDMDKCYIWMDYCCLNQDINPVLEVEELDEIMARCDCVFSPIADKSLESSTSSSVELNTKNQPQTSLIVESWKNKESSWKWDLVPETSSGFASLSVENQASAWATHLNAAWTRLEMFYGANIPLSNATTYKLFNKNFNMELEYALGRKRRPHFIFGTKHKISNLNPVCLPPIPNTFFERFHPLRGRVSLETDKVRIERLVNDLKPFMTLVNDNLVGAHIASPKERKKKKKKKWGRYVYATNDVYEGDFYGPQLQMRHGQGRMVYASGDVYNGGWYRDLRQGEGTLQEANGSVYIGFFEADKKHGVGKYTAAAAGLELWSYNGDWRNGMRSGQGRLVCVTGEEYEGGFQDNCYSGKGVLTYIDGSTYTGHFVQHQKHGYGRMVYSNGKVYCGDWECGEYHGEGELQLPTGDTYKGTYVCGVMHGKGRFLYANGESYDGQWVQGEAHGRGVFHYNDGAVYEGDCKHFVKDGHGKYTFSSGSVYEGAWQAGMQHGRGTFSFSGGDVYCGDWVEDMMTGEGVFTYTSGEVYTGAFVDDMRCGQGIMRYPDGDVYEGQWQNDLYCGRGTMTYASGSLFVGFWKNGVQDGYGWFVNSRGGETEGVWKDGVAVERNNQFWTMGVETMDDVKDLCATAGKVKRF